MDFRQSDQFARYLAASGWTTAKLADGTYVYIFKIPFLGSILRIPRITSPIPFAAINQLTKKHGAILVKLEPDALESDHQLKQQLSQHGYQLDHWSIEPTQTLVVDLTESQHQLFKNIRPKWQKYIKHAQKKVIIKASDNIDEFINIWQDNALKKGFLIDSPAKTRLMWDQFRKIKAAKLLFAYVGTEPVAASFFIFWHKKAHLWHFASTYQFDLLHPTRLLMWQSILYAKSHYLAQFDMEGTSFFKKGFGGVEKQFIGSYVKYYHPLTSIPFKLLAHFTPALFRLIYKKFYG